MLRADGRPITPRMAREAMDARLAPAPIESRPLSECAGSILRQDVYAERDNPPFDRVCMDGIAIRSDELAQGVRRFTIQAMQAAGTPALTLSGPSSAIEVTTGAIMPRGTDCVIPLEEYDAEAGIVTLKDGASGGSHRNVQQRGSDSQPGVPMLRAGMRLGAPEIAVAASAGLAAVNVSRQPSVVVVSTGDELVEPGRPIAEHQIRRSNAHAVVAALRGHGFRTIGDDHIPDSEEILGERLALHLAARDVLILSGGVSKGRFDFVPRVLKSLRVEEVFHEVAQRPGMPMWFGIGPRGQAVFGLPGNPVSTLMCLIRYVVPAVNAAMGARAGAAEPIALGAPISRGGTLTSFVPVVIQHDAAGGRAALPRVTKGSGDFLALAGTDGFIELPPRAEGYPAGFVADWYRW
ncbi:MAG TPA: molybdopterin molybdotransferase MoeA [Steroidobacteraceae bacterium]|nr:molybdopterin molybdotransferase MoeA [Steroidobacteraceae bacterium]